MLCYYHQCVPISYAIDRQRGRVELTVTESLLYADTLAFNKAVATDEGFVRALDLLVDYQGVRSTDMSVGQIGSMADCSPFDRRCKRALVHGDNQLAYGLGRMFETISEHLFPNLRLFRTREEAIEWLDETAGV